MGVIAPCDITRGSFFFFQSCDGWSGTFHLFWILDKITGQRIVFFFFIYCILHDVEHLIFRFRWTAAKSIFCSIQPTIWHCGRGESLQRQRLFSASRQEYLCMSLWIKNRPRSQTLWTPTEAVVHFRTGPWSHTDSHNLPLGKRKPSLDSAKKKKKLGAPGREAPSRLALIFFFLSFFFGLCIIKLRPNALKWIISNTEWSYFGVLLRFHRLRSHRAPALRLPHSAARPYYYL